MRVALVAPYDPGVPGGVQGQVVGLARALAAGGDTVLVVGPGDPAHWGGGLGALAPAVRLVGVGPAVAVPANGSMAPLCASPLAGVRTSAVLEGFGPDVVHVHEPFVPGPALAAARRAPAPVVATFHRSGASAPYRLAGPALRRIARRAAALVAVSDAARATLEAVVGREARRASVLGNAVDLDRFAGARARSTPAARTGAPTIVFVGRLEPRKGVAVLLEAMGRLERPARLVVVGDGPLRGRLAKDVPRGGGREVVLAGRLDDDGVASEVATADVLVAPSLGGESFGVVLLEAMAAGTAVVASDLPGYRLAAGDAARFVAPGDAGGLAEALGGLLGDGAARAELRARGLERAGEHGFASLAAAYRDRYGACSPTPATSGP